MRHLLGVLLLTLSGCHPATTSSRVPPTPASVSESVPGERASALPPSADADAPQGVPACSRDLDCALTHRLPDCCTGCAARALSLAARDALEARCGGHDASCIQPLCREPSAAPAAVCVEGRCEVRPGRLDRR